jgi:hypothetical protein
VGEDGFMEEEKPKRGGIVMTTLLGFLIWVTVIIVVWGILGLVARLVCVDEVIHRRHDDTVAPSTNMG